MEASSKPVRACATCRFLRNTNTVAGVLLWRCGAAGGHYCAMINPEGKCELWEAKPPARPWLGLFAEIRRFFYGEGK